MQAWPTSPTQAEQVQLRHLAQQDLLSIACFGGDASTASAALASGASIDEPSTFPTRSPLELACCGGHTEIARLLIASGARIDGDPAGPTPLRMACGNGHINTVSMLLAAGAAVGMPEGAAGFTPLIDACCEGHTEVASMLLVARAEVNQASEYGTTPLSMASSNGHVEMLSMLLAAGAVVDGAVALTPLYEACEKGHTEAASVLLAAGAEVDKSDAIEAYIDSWHYSTLVLLNQEADHAGATPLLIACFNGHLACVQLMSSHGASRNSEYGDSAEDIAESRGHAAISAWLVTSREWITPLHHLKVLDIACARKLLRTGAHLHAVATAGGPSPLSLAHELHAAGEAPEGSAAQLVLAAVQPWSTRTHDIFPRAARARAMMLLLLGHRLSQHPRFAGQQQGFFDVWKEVVMPHAVCRSDHM